MWVKARGSKPGPSVTAVVSPNPLNKGPKAYGEARSMCLRAEVSRLVGSKGVKGLISGVSGLCHPDA